MSENAAIIYMLIDPSTDEVRYIGKANDVLKRFRQHLCSKAHFPLYNWINKLNSRGEAPRVASLSRVLQKDWQETECLWIEWWKRQGAPLLNATNGGDGTLNPYQQTGLNAEMGKLKQRIARSLHDKHLSPETKEKTRAFMRRMAATYPELFPKWANT